MSKHIPNLRPTTSKTKQALFNTLYSIYGDISDTIWLDCFAGTGSVGIDALQKKAKHCTFIEKNPKHIKIIEENLTKYRLKEKSKIINFDLLSSKVDRLKRGYIYDFIFADPPYEIDQTGLLHFINTAISDILAEQGIFILEFRDIYRDAIMQGITDRLTCIQSKTYGDTCLLIYTHTNI